MRRTPAIVVAAVVLLIALPGEGGAVSRRKECKQACGAMIDACVAAGGKRKKCKRQTLKQCRKGGVIVCTGSTTTIGPGTTSTTTTPGGRGTTSTTAPGESIHGCTPASATDSTAPSANRTTTFSNYSFSFPKCRRIAVGQSVLFVGQFSNHPLVGGEVAGGVETPDPASPITNAADVGTNQKQATFPTAGTFPFYCDEHGASFGMVGVVYVE